MRSPTFIPMSSSFAYAICSSVACSLLAIAVACFFIVRRLDGETLPRRLLLRLVLGSALELGVDANGQFTIPEELRQFANLNNEIFLVGQGEYFEIWAPELWGQQETQLRDAEANTSRFSALTISVHSAAAAG